MAGKSRCLTYRSISAGTISDRGQNADDAPALAIIFYDENRGVAGRGIAGPWTGTFGWQREVKRIEVPPRTREAIICIGLFGAVGEIAFDDIEFKAAHSP